ncbi:hypothetical protein PV381_31945 [Streptomyces scabiei]|uniref:hypothetical protein n=1 Tax=Streptomyces scabiei TaxID=1930 RepID=UPI0029A5ED0C|nr:hypothetical protein [Streptomyces scabiei]MDX2631110.1 hypothetical protein [Streptomyces scabiei]MDX2631115.1 hypothetical protein [Streptomyces scabiei]
MTEPELPASNRPNPAVAMQSAPASGAGRARFPLVRWILAPRTTWLARRMASDFGPGMDARTAWVMARVQRHPDEIAYAVRHLDDGELPG